MDRATRLVSGRARAGVRLCRAYTTGSASTFDPVVTPKWLEEQRNVKILDATWYLPSKKLDGKDDFRKARIPNAQYFDIDAIADKSASLKHMLPPSNAFAAAMDSLNITNSDTVVVYETNGIAFAAARAWWMFRCFGHDDVRVLDGGMPAWRKDGNLALDENVVGSHLINAPGLAAMEAQESGKSDFKYQATLRENLVVSKQDILSDLSKEDNKKFLLDARGEARFRGTEPEAKPGLRSGHIPGSFSMHYNSLLQDGTLMKSKETLLENGLFCEALEHSKNGEMAITATCGSGVTACVIAVAFARFGQEVSVYDGSWSDWGADPDLPLETG